MSKSAPRLGRGLSSLIPSHSAEFPREHVAGAPETALRHVPLQRIRPNRNQPRKSFDPAAIEQLASSLRSSGVLQPVLLRPLPDGEYELVAGERRWRAAQAAGLPTVPAIIRETTDSESLELALIENLQREDLNPLDRAAAYRQYIDAFGATAEQLAERVGESRANVANYLRILTLPQEVHELISAGQLAMGQARAIAGIQDRERQLAIARLTVRRNLAVRQVEALVRERQATDPQPAAPTGHRRHLDELGTSLSRALGLPVRVISGRKKNSGRVVISYSKLEEFDRIADALGLERAVE